MPVKLKLELEGVLVLTSIPETPPPAAGQPHTGYLHHRLADKDIFAELVQFEGKIVKLEVKEL